VVVTTELDGVVSGGVDDETGGRTAVDGLDVVEVIDWLDELEQAASPTSVTTERARVLFMRLSFRSSERHHHRANGGSPSSCRRRFAPLDSSSRWTDDQLIGPYPVEMPSTGANS
jgi:hypothetical protein